jgi:hypothetical protein
MATKCSLFRRVTISNAEFATRSVVAWSENKMSQQLQGSRAGQNFRRRRKNAKHRSPAGTHILDAGLDHLLKALEYLYGTIGLCAISDEVLKPYHISNLRIRIVRHGVLERSQEILLEPEVGQLLLFEEPHSKLPERIEGKEPDMGITMTTDLRDD